MLTIPSPSPTALPSLPTPRRLGPLRRAARRVLGGVGLALSPRTCCGCASAQVDGDGLCADCRCGLVPASRGGCAVCGAVMSDGTVHHPTWRCRICIVKPPPYDHAVAAHVYGGPLRDAIIAWKNRPAFHMSGPLATLCARGLEARLAAVRAPDRFVPVPSRRAQLARRGFNPAAILAEGLVSAVRERGTAAPALALAGLGWADKDHRLTSTKGSRRSDRVSRVAGAFKADPAVVGGRRIWLVDDVMTTGATVAACADALRAAGAIRIDVLVLARVEGLRGV